MRSRSGFICCSCAPQYPQLCVPFGGKLNTALRPPAAWYFSWNSLFVLSVMFSRYPALN